MQTAAHFLEIGPDGWAVGAVQQLASPHFDARPAMDGPAAVIDTVVLHAISLPPLEFGTGTVEPFFCGTLDCASHPGLRTLEGVRVSSHFYIRRTGAVVQFVSCLDRAWHAGVSRFNGRVRCNDFSIGIELEGSDFVPFEDAQYAALEMLLGALARRYPLRYLVAHSDIAPGRKTDPGPYFDWTKLWRARQSFAGLRFAGAAAQMQLAALHARLDAARV